MIETLIALSIFKRPFQVSLFLNVLPLLIGIFYFLRARIFYIEFLPIVLLCLINGVVLLFLKDWGSIARLGQVLCLLGFSHFLSSWLNHERLLRIGKYLLIFSLVQLSIEVIFYDSIGDHKNVFGLMLPRYSGPIGESNFSGLAIATISCLLFQMKRRLLPFLGLVMVALCASRTGILLIASFLALKLLYDRYGDHLKKPSYAALTVLSLTPVFIYLININGHFEVKSLIEKASSGRFYLWVAYIDMAIDNIWGVGYFNGWDTISNYIAHYKEEILKIREFQLNEQHNIFVQIISEFGIIGYLLFIWQLKIFFDIYIKGNIRNLPIFLSFLISLSFLNGLTNFLLFLLVGHAMSQLSGDGRTLIKRKWFSISKYLS